MAYKTYTEQVNEHINFLHSKKFDMNELKVNADFVRCNEIGKQHGRGEFVYKTRTKILNNGLTGVQTWFRGSQGETGNFHTYGLGPLEILVNKNPVRKDNSIEGGTSRYGETGRKAYGFWQHSSVSGRSEYLERKGVGYYGIRFRSSEQYGDVAVIPMVDVAGRLWNYQLLNPDGSKRHPKDSRTEGLFHILGDPLGRKLLGIAESYVTAASCLELTGMPTVCAFASQNLKNVSLLLRKRYPESIIFIFADNDKQHENRGLPNQGLSKAQEAIDGLGNQNTALIAPDFGDSGTSKHCSDWNDLITQGGFECAKVQIQEKIAMALKWNASYTGSKI